MNFPNPKAIKVFHLSTTGVQSYTPGATIEGTFLPLSRHEFALAGGDPATQNELYIPPEADVRVTDKLEIEGSTYFVRFVFSAPFGGLAHKRLTLSSQP
jgi:hypothetical protein